VLAHCSAILLAGIFITVGVFREIIGASHIILLVVVTVELMKSTNNK